VPTGTGIYECYTYKVFHKRKTIVKIDVLTFILKLFNIIVYTALYTVQYFVCVTFMYTLHKAEISSINLLKPCQATDLVFLSTLLICTAWKWLLNVAETCRYYHNCYSKIVHWWVEFLSLCIWISTFYVQLHNGHHTYCTCFPRIPNN